MKLRVGLIGLGDTWETRHRPALRMLHDRFEVRAVFSTVAKLAENSAAEFQADPMDGYRALVSRCDIDAVMVLKRTWLGWLPMLAAAEAGKAIYWAGDLGFESSSNGDVRKAIERSGVAFMVEFPRRFAPATLRLKELIATRLGAPKLMFCHRRTEAPPTSDLHQDLVHRDLVELIDWCRYMVGVEPESVTSTCGNSEEVNADETGYRCLSLRFPGHENKSGVHRPSVQAQISCGNYIQPTWHEAVSFRPPSAMQICCEHGVAFIDLPSTLVWFDNAGRHVESLETELPVGEQLLSHFHRSVTSLVRNISELDDAHRASSILAAAQESNREGRRISLATNR